VIYTKATFFQEYQVIEHTKQSVHQCSKDFLPRLFFTFYLGSRTEAYWGEAKRYTFWPRLSPEAIDPVLCLGCFETGAIYTTFCLGSVRTEAIGDKFFFNSNFRRLLNTWPPIFTMHTHELLECEVEICNTYFNIPEQEFR